MDVDARMQLFDFKTLYRFQTTPGINQYNMPLYSLQTEPTGSSQTIGPYPMYQGFTDQCSINGVRAEFITQRNSFYNYTSNYVQSLLSAGTGTGVSDDTYTINIQFSPAIPGHVDMSGIIAQYNFNNSIQDPPVNTTLLTSAAAPYNGNSVIPNSSVFSTVYFTSVDSNGQTVVVADSGQFLTGNVGYGLLMSQGSAPFGISPLPGGYSSSLNTINYSTGEATFRFPTGTTIPSGTPINAQCYVYSQGRPTSIMYYNNTLTLDRPPDISYLVELEAYLTPSAFINTSSFVPFAYMCEYIARGAARKMLSDTGDVEQFMFYEPLFKEQELLVWKRSQRVLTSTRTETIFSSLNGKYSGNLMGVNQ